MAVGKAFVKLVEIMSTLRSDNGCPWDRQQTHESLRQYLLEETHELLAAIDSGDYHEVREELGDVLLQVVFHAQIASEFGRFDIADVIQGISDKMVRRHPHVFGDENVESANEQVQRWENLKKEEGKRSKFDGLPKTLPALQRAHRLQQKASVNATRLPTWQHASNKFDAVLEKLLRANAAGENWQRDVGEILFAMVSLAGKHGVNAEDALRQQCERFEREAREQEVKNQAGN